MTPLLVAKDISLSFPTKRIFDATTLSVAHGSRTGIVGKNGDGKTSLLKLLSGSIEPDTGTITKRSDVTVGILHQSDSLDPTAPALQAATGNSLLHEWAAERKSREIIETLFEGIAYDTCVGELSGGQRRRVDLARVLIQSWDVLMLDEPTNHLDMQTILWLTEHLKSRWPEGTGALLVVTHDRWFIDEVCTTMWEVHDGHVSGFEGGYSVYVMQRVERDRLMQLAEEKRQNIMRKELAWLSRGARARATKPKFHVKMARELIANEPPPRNSLELKRAAMARLGKQVLECIQASVILGGKPILSTIDFLIGPGDRLAILGGNGAGKTTFLRLMAGELTPTSGEVRIGKTVQMAYLSQALEELKDVMDCRVLEVLEQHKRGYTIDGKHVSSTELLKRLGFEQAYFMAYVKDLSGGQKRRLQLLLTLLREPNVMILDEPGNDFDTDMLAVLEDLLDTWPGTLILVSHDRYLVERVTDMQYMLENGKLRHLPGGVEEYLKRARDGQGTKGSLSESDAISSQGVKYTTSEAHEARKQLASTERRMHTLESQIKKQAAILHTCDPTDYLALGDEQAKLDALQVKLLELETIWLDVSERLEKSATS